MQNVHQTLARIQRYFTALKIPYEIVVIVCDDQRLERKIRVSRTCVWDLFNKNLKSQVRKCSTKRHKVVELWGLIACFRAADWFSRLPMKSCKPTCTEHKSQMTRWYNIIGLGWTSNTEQTHRPGAPTNKSEVEGSESLGALCLETSKPRYCRKTSKSEAWKQISTTETLGMAELVCCLLILTHNGMTTASKLHWRLRSIFSLADSTHISAAPTLTLIDLKVFLARYLWLSQEELVDIGCIWFDPWRN